MEFVYKTKITGWYSKLTRINKFIAEEKPPFEEALVWWKCSHGLSILVYHQSQLWENVVKA